MPFTKAVVRWGILGTGYISREFAQGLKSLPDAQLVAIGSRTLTSAQEFARQLGVSKAYGSYEELVKDPDVDVIYIGTPNSRHRDDCILCLEAGKHVLCEKPFTTNAREAREVIEFARQRQLFCMEAMWMRFMPLVQKVRELIKSGAIGEICTLVADFGYPAAFNPESRLFNLQLGGGALIDRGVYPISLAYYLLGVPTNVTGQAAIGRSQVDEQSTYLLQFPKGELALLSGSMRSYASNEAVITGTRGQIRIHAPFYKPHQLSITQLSEAVSGFSASTGSSGLKQKLLGIPVVQRLYLQFGSGLLSRIRQPVSTVFQPYEGNGYQYEAAEVIRCLQQGKTESPIMPLDETLQIMETMDQLRQQWGLKYPQD